MINKNDLIDLARLLSKGYSLQDSLHIIGNYEFILNELSTGRKIEEFIQLNKKETFYQTLSFFIQISSFDQAILSAYEYDTFKKQLKMNWMKEISYPILLLCFSCAVYLFFDFYIYPQLQSIIIQQNSFMLNEILIILFRLLMILFVSIFIFIFIYFIFIKRNDQYYSMFYHFLSKMNAYKKIISYDYAIHTLVLMKRGLSTKQVFDSLLLFKNNQLLQIPLKEMIEQLQKGIEMNQIIDELDYFDSKFKQFYKIGYYAQSLEESMNDYCQYQEEEFKKYLKLSSKIMTISAYLFVAIFIVSIYQMLLVPLEMIQQF